MTTLFLSYRRSDSAALCRTLHERLKPQFDVFIDTDSIPLGNPFPEILADRLEKCDGVFIVVGRNWVTVADVDGTPRLYDPTDFVRLEVEAALKAAKDRRIPVVPVLVDGADMPDARRLPMSLRPFCELQAFRLEGASFEESVDTLSSRLQREIALKDQPQGKRPAETGPSDRKTAPMAAELIGRDRSWRLIAEKDNAGEKLIVLIGARGIGKSATALAFARWSRPAEEHRDILVIDGRDEFNELALVNAVGARYPDEFYGPAEGAPFSPLSLRELRRSALALLARREATVIFDEPDQVSYPRDGNAEVDLAREMTKKLTEKSVRVIVAAGNEACWADKNPVRLQGLSRDHALALLRRETSRGDSQSADVDLANLLGGAARLEELVSRGNPGELIAAARQATARTAPHAAAATPNVAVRFLGALRHAAELLLGDPVNSRPTPPSERVSGMGALFVIALLLIVAATMALVASYGTSSAMWERMFFDLAARDNVPPHKTAKQGGLGSGLLSELAGAVIVVIGLIVVVVGVFFGRQAAQLIPRMPWHDLGPRRLGVRSLFRLIFLALTFWMTAAVLSHQLHQGPRILWMCNGNRFLQDNLEDPVLLKACRELPAEHLHKMNDEPPGVGEPDYDRYRSECLYPYLLYFPYAFIMFAVAAPIGLTVCFYSIVAALWQLFVLQPRELERLPDDTSPREIDNRLRLYESSLRADLEQYLFLFFVLLSCLAFALWFSAHNLTKQGAGHSKEMLAVGSAAWVALFLAVVLAYPPLVRTCSERIPDEAAQVAFLKRHNSLRFFRDAILGSSYFWLCLAAAGLAASKALLSAFAG